MCIFVLIQKNYQQLFSIFIIKRGKPNVNFFVFIFQTLNHLKSKKNHLFISNVIQLDEKRETHKKTILKNDFK